MRSYISIFTIVILISCSKGDDHSGTSLDSKSINVFEKEENVSLEKLETLTLDDNIHNISLFTFSHEENNKRYLLYVDEELPAINKIDIDTHNIISIGKEGRGPFEYTRPKYLGIRDLIYVWDAMQLKFLVFDKEGNAVRESTTLTRALNKFDVINEDSLALYMSGGFDGPFIGIYSFSEEAVLEESLTGEQTKSDLLLTILNGTGGILTEYPYIYYVRPSSLNIHVINLMTNEETVSRIRSPDFQVDEFNGDVRQFVNTDREGLVRYLLNNSAAMGIYRYHDFFVIKSINGKAVGGALNQNDINHENRYYGFYVLNDQFEVVGYFKRDFNLNTDYEIFNDALYELILDEENHSSSYKINKYYIHIQDN